MNGHHIHEVLRIINELLKETNDKGFSILEIAERFPADWNEVERREAKEFINGVLKNIC